MSVFLLTISFSQYLSHNISAVESIDVQAFFKRALLYYLQDFPPRIFTYSASFDADAFLILSEGVNRTTFWEETSNLS